METYRRTVYGAALQTAQVLGLPITIHPNTTLNEKLQINPTATLNTHEIPTMKYLSIGIGGHRGTTGADGMALIETLQHSAADASSYRMLPYVMRPLSSDLNSTEIDRYALRRMETHNGIDYAVYYLRRIDLSDVVISLKKKVVSNGKETVSEFVPGLEVLDPIPPVTTPGANVVDGTYLYATAQVKIDFDSFDAQEILNSAKILYGDEKYAFISEFGFVTGVDRMLPSQTSDGTFTMREVVAAQIFCHVSALQPIYNQKNGFEAMYEVGISEPLMVLTGP